jgi:hypothetical protein
MGYQNRKSRCTTRQHNLRVKKGETPLYDIGPISWALFFNIIYNANYRLFSLFRLGGGSKSKCIVVCVLLKYRLKAAL